MDIERILNIIVMAAAFGFVFSIWCICLLLWAGQTLARTKLLQNRLGITKKETDPAQTVRLWQERRREFPEGSLAKKATLRDRLETLRTVMEWGVSVYVVFFLVGCVSLLGFVLAYFISGNLMLGIAIGAAVVIVFWRYVLMRISKYRDLLDVQFVDGLGICSRALRAGLPLLGSFQLISEEVDKPIGNIFGRICHEQVMGKDLKDSIKKVAETVPSAEFKLFATSIAIQLQSGGNLAELMDSLASIVRSRIRLNRRVRILTAQTQFSKRVLIALPCIVFLLLNIVNPEYMVDLYSTKTGQHMLAVTVVLMFVGSWIMNKLAVLKF